MSGTLHLVGTPIGNLGDITQRALDVLSAVERVYAEDTRRTRALLSALGIGGKKLSSLHAHSSDRAVETALEILREGRDLALVTDAGMPGISDPGAALVRAAREAGFAVTAAPGPSAVTTAVALSGLVEGPFTFYGFLPRKGRRRGELVEQLLRSDIPVLFFESPQRIQDTLEELSALAPERQAAVCRELTKRFEEVRVGALSELAAPSGEWLGELTIVLAPRAAAEAAQAHAEAAELESEALEERARALLAAGHRVKDVVQELLPGASLPKRELYTLVQRLHDERA